MNHEDYNWMARERSTPHAGTEPFAWRAEGMLQDALQGDRAQHEEHRRERRHARDIRVIKRLAWTAVILLGLLTAGTGVGAGLIATVGHVPATACKSIVSRC